jgi:RNA polymerase sigma factor (sigma-70 family)
MKALKVKVRKPRELTGIDKIRYLRDQHVEAQKPRYTYPFERMTKDFDPVVVKLTKKYALWFSPEDTTAFAREGLWDAWKKAPTVEVLPGYAIRESENRIREEIRAIQSHGITWTSKKVPVEQNGDKIDLRPSPLDPPPSLEDEVLNKVTLEEFEKQKLRTKFQRRVLRWKLKGLTQREIAAKMGVTEQRVSHVWNRIEKLVEDFHVD